jgi:hypothetical protein
VSAERNRGKEIVTGAAVFAVSPAGRWILCTQLDRADSDIMLVENFR